MQLLLIFHRLMIQRMLLFDYDYISKKNDAKYKELADVHIENQHLEIQYFQQHYPMTKKTVFFYQKTFVLFTKIIPDSSFGSIFDFRLCNLMIRSTAFFALA